MYRKIVLAVDGSSSSDLALTQAITLAKACRAEVEALFIAENVDVYFDAGYYNPDMLMKAILANGQHALNEAGQRLSQAGIEHQLKLIERPVSPGKIADTIVAEADARNADLIVLGTHGRRGVRRLVVGSVAEGVIRQSNKPVLLIRSEKED